MQQQEETEKMMNQSQSQVEQAVTMLDSARDMLNQHKHKQDKVYPRISMQTEIR